MSTILALDIGTEVVKAVLARSGKHETLNILGAGSAEQENESMHAGAIANIPAVVATCEKAIYDAEKEAGERAKMAVVGVAGELVKSSITTVNYHRENANKPIIEDEIEQIIKKVQQKSGEIAHRTAALETENDKIEMRLVNSAIVSIEIDGYKITNPIGFKGSEMTIRFYTAFAPLVQVAAIEKICAELNLELLTLAVDPFAICRAYLGNNLDDRGSEILVDIGSATTNVAMVVDGGIFGTKTLTIGKTALERKVGAWLTGFEVALEDFELDDELPHEILLCGGGADSSLLQETLAISDWYKSLNFSRRPVVDILSMEKFSGIRFDKRELGASFATAIGLLRVGIDTLESAPEEKGLKHKIERLLQK